MAKHSQTQRWVAGRIAQIEAKRRALAVARVGGVVLITILATLVFSGHRMAPDCMRAIICIERGSR